MATRWGFISAGKISHDFVTALGTLPAEEHKVVAVAARKLEDAQAFAKIHDIPQAYGRYQDIAKNPDVQVVYIGCINTNHYQLGKLMLENGKHVLIEKPLCLSLRECEALMEMSKSRKLFLMEAIWSRFLPSYVYLMEKLSSGAAGEAMNVDCSLGFALPDVDNLRKRDHGGGALVNMGIYCLNAIALVYDHEPPEKILVAGHLNEEGVDETLSVLLQYSKGRLANFTTSFKMNLPCELRVDGTKGTLKVPGFMYCPTEVIFEKQSTQFPLPTSKIPTNYPNSVGLRYEAMEVRKCLLEGLYESPRLSHKQSLHIHAVMTEIRRQMGITFPTTSDLFGID